MKKSVVFVFPLLLLSSCQNPSLVTSSILTTISSSLSTKEEVSSSNTILTTSSDVDDGVYNPDGSRHLPVPETHVKETWESEKEVRYSFLDSFPEGFNYIYGHKIVNQPNFYQDETKGWKIRYPDTPARMGVQTPLFDSDLKIEIRLYITNITNSENKVVQDEPWIRVYGFNKEGILKQTKEVQCPTNFYGYKNSSNAFNFYMSGENVDYLEIRFIAPPYKGSQCYNFGIKEIGFKTFPYQYVED